MEEGPEDIKRRRRTDCNPIVDTDDFSQSALGSTDIRMPSPLYYFHYFFSFGQDGFGAWIWLDFERCSWFYI